MSYVIEKDWITEAGLRAIVLRSKKSYLRHRCGYVAVPEGLEAWGKDYDDVGAEVHGGLTYGAFSSEYPVATPEDTYWLGYDCAHYGDTADGGQSLDYCIAECESLTKQLNKEKQNEQDE